MPKPTVRSDTLDESPTVEISALGGSGTHSEGPLGPGWPRPARIRERRRAAAERRTLSLAMASPAGSRSPLVLPEMFGPAAMGTLLLPARTTPEVLARAYSCWSAGFEITGRFVVLDGDVLGSDSTGLEPAAARQFRGARLPACRHWLLRDVLQGREPYLGEGSAEVGSTWLTDRLGLAPSARVAALPIQDARGEVIGVFVGNGARATVDLEDLHLMRAAIRAGHRLVQAREALGRLAGHAPHT